MAAPLSSAAKVQPAEPVGAMRAEIEKAFSGDEARSRREAAGARAGSFTPKEGAPRSDRRGMDALRDEALRNVISQVEDRNFGGIKPARTISGRRFGRQRLILVGIALASAGLAAFLSTQTGRVAPEPMPVEQASETVVASPQAQVLVLTQAVAAGQRLSPDVLAWQDWPEGNVRPEYLTLAASPDALAEVGSQVARFALFAGEPLRRDKLADAGAGLMAGLLRPGMRGVSVAVTADTAAGGFIAPNDRVDVVITRTLEGGGQVSDTVAHGVRVIAINDQIGERAPPSGETPVQPQTFSGGAIATLELDDREAMLVNSAATIGRLSLAVRSSTDALAAEAGDRRVTLNQQIRMTSPFWTGAQGGGAGRQ